MVTDARPAARGSTTALAIALARHPGLWPVAARQCFRLARPRWWAHRPFLPVPDPDYLAFRMETQYGGTGAARAEPDDLIRYLAWCRDQDRVIRRRRGVARR